jgi:hypothetical protein
MNSTGAKQFLISRVIAEAELEQVSLSDIEKQMLAFTETDPFPGMYEINSEFERSYNADEYEAKIALLLKNARQHDREKSPDHEKQWHDALLAMHNEDHYVLVMVKQAFESGFRQAPKSENRARDVLVYLMIAILVAVILVWKVLR